MQKTLQFLRREMGGATRDRFMVAHALSPDTAASLRDAIVDAFEATDLFMVETGE